MQSRLLIQSKFNPSRGGHAPGDVRDAFLEAVETWAQSEQVVPDFTVEVRGQRVPIGRVCGLVWNCTDIMPGDACAAFEIFGEDLPQGSTYAKAARCLKALVATDDIAAI